MLQQQVMRRRRIRDEEECGFISGTVSFFGYLSEETRDDGVGTTNPGYLSFIQVKEWNFFLN